MAQVNIQYTADISNLNNGLSEIIKKQEQASSSAKKLGDDLSDAAKKAKSETDKLDSGIGRLTAAITSAFAASKVIEFTKTLIEAERKIELLQNRLNFLAGSASAGEQMFTRLEAISRRLGLNLEDTAEGLASFGIAAQQAGFSAQKSEKIFVQVASGLRAAGASSLQTQRAFYALQQMMSKGVVAAEELRRQLGESLPGASDLMTKAYNRLHPAANLTSLEFTKLLESGKIISKDILPEFAMVIEETFAPALSGKSNSLDASLNRVNNEILKLKLNIGNADWFKAAAKVISDSLYELNAVLSSESLSTLDKIYASLFVGDPEKTKRAVGAFDMINTAINEQNKNTEQAIITNNVFGKQLDKQTDKYKKMSENQRSLTKQQLESEFDKNKKLIKEADKMNVSERIRRNKEITDAKSRNEFLSALRMEYYNLDEERANASSKATKIENQGLRDFIALQKIRLAEAVKGSEEELSIKQTLIVAEAQLRAEGEKLTAKERKAIMEQSYREAEELTKGYNDRIFKEYQNAIKSGEKFAKDLRKTFREGLYATITDPMQLEIEKTIDYYNDLIDEAQKLGLDTIALEKAKYAAIDAIRKKSADKEKAERRDLFEEQVREVQIITNAFSEFFSSRLELESETAKSALDNLEQRFNKGLISEKQYEEQKLKLQKEAFEREKSLQIARAIMSGANAILSIIGNPTTAALAPVLIPLALGTTATQLSIIESQTPGFKEGVIGLNGPGTETSDSILARLSKGESVMTAAETRKHKDVLEAIRHDRLPSLIAEKYIIPAYKDSMDKPRKAASDATSMEAAFQTAELVQAIKGNKKIKIANVDEFSRAINSKSTSEYMARRRKW
jgi:tape measure domain-containing protein